MDNGKAVHVHDMKIYGGVVLQLHSLLISEKKLGWVYSFVTRPFLPRKKCSGLSFYIRLFGADKTPAPEEILYAICALSPHTVVTTPTNYPGTPESYIFFRSYFI